MFKVGTEITLLVTLTLAVMLKIDLSTEALPCFGVDSDTKVEAASCGETFVGLSMHVILPPPPPLLKRRRKHGLRWVMMVCWRQA